MYIHFILCSTADYVSVLIINVDNMYICCLPLDPMIALQQTSYTFPESTPEADASICVVLESPSGGLAIPFGVMFSIIPGTASTLHVTVNCTVASILIVYLMIRNEHMHP